MVKSKVSGSLESNGNGGVLFIKSWPINLSVSVMRVKGPLAALAFILRKEQISFRRVIPAMGSPSRKAWPVLVLIKCVTLFSQSNLDWVGKSIPADEGQEVPKNLSVAPLGKAYAVIERLPTEGPFSARLTSSKTLGPAEQVEVISANSELPVICAEIIPSNPTSNNAAILHSQAMVFYLLIIRDFTG